MVTPVNPPKAKSRWDDQKVPEQKVTTFVAFEGSATGIWRLYPFNEANENYFHSKLGWQPWQKDKSETRYFTSADGLTYEQVKYMQDGGCVNTKEFRSQVKVLNLKEVPLG